MLCIMLHITQECHGFVQLGQEVTTQNCLIIKQKIWAIVQCNLKFDEYFTHYNTKAKWKYNF
jgi:hypothetical protein